MTINAGGSAGSRISLGDIRTELSATGALSLNDTRVRRLAGILAGPIKIGDCNQKTRITVVPGFSDFGGGNGFTGWLSPATGSRSPTNYLTPVGGSHFINEISTGIGAFAGSLNFTLLTGGLPQTTFTFIMVNGQKFLTSGVTSFSNGGGSSSWNWSGVVTPFTNGVQADIYLG